MNIEGRESTHDRASGVMHLEKATVRWFLSINYDVIPEPEKQA